MKEKLGKQIFKDTIIFFLFIFSIELIVRFNTLSVFIGWPILRISLSSLIIALIIGSIISIKNSLIKKIIASLLSIIVVVYAWVEINLYFYLGFFMGAGNAEQGTKVIDYIKEYLNAAKGTTYLLLIPFILILIYYWFLEKKLKVKKLNKTVYFKFSIEKKSQKIFTYFIVLIIIILLSFIYYCSLKTNFMQNELQSTNNISLIKYPENSNLSVSQFGVLVYGITDLNSVIFKLNYNNDYVYTYINENIKSHVTDYSRIIDDYFWNELISNESNNNYNNLNKYFINREITPKNEYTGLFEGKNLIVILMESANEIVINEELFPNIYKLYSEGISFRNNYSPRNSCSTGNNEMTVITGLYTINNTCTANTYKSNTYYQSLFNHFNNTGYSTSSYHDYAEFYYSRRIIHPNMGSQVYRNASDLGIKWSALYEEWPSDVDLIEKSVPYFINDEKFMTFLISVTSHQPYSVDSEYGNKNLDRLTQYNYNKPIKRYLSKILELDAAIGLLMQKLEESGKLNDTVIVLFGDHYPYGISNKYLDEIMNYDLINNEVDRTPLIIYNSEKEAQQISKYTSLIDLAPTILNLFNMNYDPRLYLGNDVFSDYDDRVIFADGSWQNKNGFYSSTNGKFINSINNDNTYNNEELIQINYEINLKQKMSSLAIKNNYFNYLENGLKKYPIIAETLETLIEE
ncbi:MAG: LTA synthase family protein [Bacilli bacterium]|nr:LTA synthase family protein [Bacilli bacterium]